MYPMKFKLSYARSTEPQLQGGAKYKATVFDCPPSKCFNQAAPFLADFNIVLFWSYLLRLLAQC